MSVYNRAGTQLRAVYDSNGNALLSAYDVGGDIVFPVLLPVPTGDLSASATVPLPDLYETGKGFTCTGLAYDSINDVFLVGDIGKLLPNSGTIKSQIMKLSTDFTTIVGTIPIHSAFSGMGDVQGITIDTSDGTIWFCAPSADKIYHTNASGENLGGISVTSPTGVSYSATDDSFWVLTYGNKILNVSKAGATLASYDFAYTEAVDQCFLDEGHGYLYITAGVNYSGRNNVYLFNVNTHEQSIICTVDSYSVEGIWIGENRMVIVNDGYYHSATDNRNVANIYDLTN